MDAGPVPENHRPVATPCSPVPSAIPDGGYPDGGLCSFDRDCADGGQGALDGRCVRNPLSLVTSCVYDFCDSDSVCDGGVCQCDDTRDNGTNVCVSGSCRIDADCGPGGFCSPQPGGCGLMTGIVGYYCHTPHDECMNDSDCALGGVTGLLCQFDTTTQMRWICAPADCAG